MAEVFLREYGDLTNLVKTVPHKEQRGFFSADVSWTCVDFTSDWVAVGTETGWLYLYDRFEESVKHRLTTKPSDRSPVTKVRLKRSVEYVVAMGTALGFVSIFRLPAPLAGLTVKLHAFGIRDLHHSAVTSFEWSQNAMKLFSGDEDGVVVCTEIDYTTNQSRSYVVCKEPHSIVQLSYAHRTLLVSTRWRTVLCNPDDAMNVTQVGRKDRKTLGPFGSVFVPGSFQPQDAIVYCARPNLSLWKADITGTVSLTVIFKTLAANLDKPFGVSLLPSEGGAPPPQFLPSAVSFSQLFVFNQELVLSYFGSGIFVVNPRSGQFVCFHASLPEIIDVAVQDDEVLLLTKPNGGTLRYLARHAFRTRLPSYLTGIPIQLSTHETKANQKTAPSSDSVASMTKSLIGVLMENVVDAVREGTSAVEQAEHSAGSPETGEEMRSSPGGDETGIQNSIPIIKLDPNEIAPLKIEPKPPEHERPTVEIKPSLTCDATNSVDKLSEEIVFKPMQKKKVRKKSKLRQPQTADVISISSGDSTHYDRSPSPVDPGRQSTGHGQMELRDCIRRSASPSLLPTSRDPLARPKSLPQSLVDPLCEPEDHQPKSLTILPSEGPSSDPPSRTTSTSLGPDVNPEPDAEPDLVLMLRSVDEVALHSTIQLTDELFSQLNRDFDVSSAKNLDLSTAEELSEPTDFQKTKLNVDLALNQDRDCDDSFRETEDTNSTVKLEEEPELKLEEKMEDDKECDKETHSHTEFQKDETKIPKGLELPSKVETTSVVDNVPTPSSPLDSFVSIYQATSVTKPPEESILEISRSVPKPAAGQPMTSFGVISEPSVVEIWTEIIAPSSLKCLTLSLTHAWCVDRHDAMYYASIDGPGKWAKVDQTAQKVAVSPNGFILWILSKNSVYAANKVCGKSPAGNEWREIIREVKSLSVDDHVAWYSKLNGEVFMQKDLKRERTSFRAIRIPCEHHVTDIFCGRGVVWAVTDDLMVLVRAGIGKGREEGSRWEPLERQSSRMVSFSLSFGSSDLVWLMDISGRIWFTSGVTSDNPHGSGIWWEVVITDDNSSASSEVALPSSGTKTSWSLWDLPLSLSRSASLVDGGATGDVVATNANGEVWVNFGKGQSVYASNGSITGHRWERSTPAGMLSSTKWRRISCSDDEGKVNVWLEQSNGDIFCISSVASDDRLTEIPPPLFNDAILSLAATSGALWCVTKGGKMFVRSGMSSHCVQGVNWISVDLSQLGNVKVVHLSVSAHNVWAVDSLGNAYLRIGVKPPSNKCINAAWLEIDRVNLLSGSHLAQVVSSPNSSMVWAIDTKKNVYIRAGVSERLPLGTKWINIPGHSFESIHLSNRHVYGLNAKDDVFVRYGISRTNPFGDFWKRIPGKFRHIAVSSFDDLWAIDRDDRLHKRRAFDLEISSESHRQRLKLLTRHDSADSEWEIIN